VKRGELWLVAGGVYASKPRPALIVQDDLFAETDSVTVCPLTTTPVDAPMLRVLIPADGTSGIRQPSYLMVDKLTTVRRANVSQLVGKLRPEQLIEFERRALVFLGFGN
jgi:mRNA interferase MazF